MGFDDYTGSSGLYPHWGDYFRIKRDNLMKARFVFMVACLVSIGSRTASAQSDVTQLATRSSPLRPTALARKAWPMPLITAGEVLELRHQDSRQRAFGVCVSPSVGVTRVVGMTIESANDAPERDPKTVTLEGSNDPRLPRTVRHWEMIATITVPNFAARFQTQTSSRQFQSL
jgi:hypothetical protein